MAQYYPSHSHSHYPNNYSSPRAPDYTQVTPVDPFKPSVAYSVQNVGGAARPNRVSYDDIPLPPGPSSGNWYPPPPPPRPLFGSRSPYYNGYRPDPPSGSRPLFGSSAPYPPYGQPPRPRSYRDRESDSQIHYYAPDRPRRRPPSPGTSENEAGRGERSYVISNSEIRPASPQYSPTSPRYEPVSPQHSPAASIVHPEEVPVPDSPITGASWPIELVQPPKSPVLTTEKRSESTIPQSIPVQHEKASAGMLIIAFLVDTLPRQIYLHFLLRLPSLYFSRVSRIFLEAEVTMPEIKQGVLHDAQHFKTQGAWFPEPYLVSPCYQKLQSSWDAFIDSLLKEWKTLNIVSVLLLSAILTVLQLDGAADDPVTRFSALISMICALMSLLFGCMYIIRFGTMRKAHKAAEWAQEAQQTQTGITWNVWIMLAMPAVWLAWSMLSYIICIMAFVWRTGTQGDGGREVMSASDALAPRIVVSCILCLGLIYFVLIASTLRRYGDLMDQAWQRRIQNWIYDQTAGPLGQGYGYQPPPRPLFSAGYTSRFAENVNSSHSTRPKTSKRRKGPSSHGVPIANRSINAPAPPGNPTGDGESEHSMSNILLRKPTSHSQVDQNERDVGHHAHYCMDDHVAHIPEDQHSAYSANELGVTGEGEEAGQVESDPAIEFTRFCGLDSGDPEVTGTMYDKTVPHEGYLTQMRISGPEWEDIYKSLEAAWDPVDHTKLEKVLHRWNKTLFNPRGGQIRLCQEYGTPWSKYAIYFFDKAGRLPYDPGCFTSTWNMRMDIIGLFESEDDRDKVVVRRLSLFSPVLMIDEQYLRTNDEDWRSMKSLCDYEDTNQDTPTRLPIPVSDDDDEDKLDTKRDSKID